MKPTTKFWARQQTAKPSPASSLHLVEVASTFLESRRGFAALGEALGEGKIATVTSLTPGEGKSTYCLTMAAVAVAHGMKTLIVDVTTFVRPGSTSLEDFLGVEMDASGRPVASPVLLGIDYVGLMVSETATVADIRAEFRRLGETYDIVLVDTASLTSWNRGNIDPQLCARAADGTILVSSNGAKMTESAKAMLDDMRRSGTKFLGIVGNGGVNV